MGHMLHMVKKLMVTECVSYFKSHNLSCVLIRLMLILNVLQQRKNPRKKNMKL